MTEGDDDRGDDVDGVDGVPDSDPEHIDPAGDLADAVESGELEVSLADDQDADDLREFIDAAESGELGSITPDIEAQVRIARALLSDVDDESDADA
jgi:hypothetical protein